VLAGHAYSEQANNILMSSEVFTFRGWSYTVIRPRLYALLGTTHVQTYHVRQIFLGYSWSRINLAWFTNRIFLDTSLADCGIAKWNRVQSLQQSFRGALKTSDQR